MAEGVGFESIVLFASARDWAVNPRDPALPTFPLAHGNAPKRNFLVRNCQELFSPSERVRPSLPTPSSQLQAVPRGLSLLHAHAIIEQPTAHGVRVRVTRR